MKKLICNNHGFTLVELMIALALSGVVATGIYSAYTAQQKVYLAQDQVVEMQQNIRGGMSLLEREIRMAGYDLFKTAGAGITVATNNQLTFTQDLDEDGDLNTGTDPGDTISYTINGDANNDGEVDSSGVSTVGRTTGAGVVYQPIAENIQAMEFLYTLADGTTTTGPVAAATLPDIRDVQVTILARAAKVDRTFTNNRVYCPGSNPYNGTVSGCVSAGGKSWGPYNDNYRRRLLTATINCRNMGL